MKRATQEAVSPMQYMAEILILKIDKKPTKDRKKRQNPIFLYAARTNRQNNPGPAEFSGSDGFRAKTGFVQKRVSCKNGFRAIFEICTKPVFARNPSFFKIINFSTKKEDLVDLGFCSTPPHQLFFSKFFFQISIYLVMTTKYT